MPCPSLTELNDIKGSDLAAMPRDELEALTWQVLELARSLANRLREDSRTSSRPPSSDNPYRKNAPAEPAAVGPDTSTIIEGGAGPAEDAGKTGEKKCSKPPGKQPGMKGYWRSQPIVVSAETEHLALVCSACQAALGAEHKSRLVSAHNSFELARGGMGLQIAATRHSYFAARCQCGHETIACPASGLSSHVEGRKRDLQMSERGMVGPMLTTFIAALSFRYRLSRPKIQEFLGDWLGFELGVATIERCVHEFGLASETVVEQLIEDVRASDVVHIDETPWYQSGVLMWLWVVVSASTVVYRIGGRGKDQLIALIGEAFLGWMVTDGYMAYRDHPRRQRCLAHLIRKALALAEGYYGPGSGFGRDLVRDLRRLIERVRNGDDDEAIKRLIARIKWSCQCNQHEIEQKVRDLAREILNDWEAVIAFVADPLLPPTNNDAERALRHAVIARRISFGTRTDEGSRFYAAGLSVIDTARRRDLDPWAYGCGLITAARTNSPLPMIPAKIAA